MQPQDGKEDRRGTLSRREFIRLAAIGSVGSIVLGCTTAPTAQAPQPTAAPAAKAAPAGWQATLDEVVAAAKKEGTIVISGPPGDTYRTATDAFAQTYPGISIEYNGLRGSQFVPRILAEREAGKFLFDVHVGGVSSSLRELRPKGILEPMRPAIFVPDAFDDTKWLNGFDGGWVEKEHVMYAMVGYIQPTARVNRQFVPKSDLAKVEQLLDPKWKGKIAWDDPRRDGSGAADAAHMMRLFGEDFIRRLFQQDVVPIPDYRQGIDWLTRGSYPIAIGADSAMLLDFQRQGTAKSVETIEPDGEAGARLSQGSSNVSLINRAPHPNAAKLFVNWILTREGQTAWVKAIGENSRRLDVPVAVPELAPNRNMKYFMMNSEEGLPIQMRAMAIAKEILK